MDTARVSEILWGGGGQHDDLEMGVAIVKTIRTFHENDAIINPPEWICSFPFSYPSVNEWKTSHWAELHKQKKSYQTGFQAILNVQRPRVRFTMPVEIHVVLVKKGTTHDAGNYDPKWLVDCVVRAGIIPDDKTKWLPRRPEVSFVQGNEEATHIRINPHKEEK